jgi:glutamine cyclotransferase
VRGPPASFAEWTTGSGRCYDSKTGIPRRIAANPAGSVGRAEKDGRVGRKSRLKKSASKPDRIRSVSRSAFRPWYFLAAVVLAAVWVAWVRAGREPKVPALGVRVVNTYPHDPAAFTQGLLWRGGRIYESTGQYGESTLRRVDLSTGAVEKSVPLEKNFFGEGLADTGSRFVQLTWKEHTAFVYDAETFGLLDRRRYDGEGWGLCYDGRRLIMSDGSDRLTFRDPDSFEEKGQVEVTLRGRPLDRLNELECVKGSVYANVWRTDRIVQIDPGTGRVIAAIDASGLLTEEDRRSGHPNILNGIAYKPESDTFLVTGKYWPKLFEVRFEKR